MPAYNFERIPEEEQRRIVDVCIEEFARRGYNQTSTNTIVKKANIPKGTLFFYFGSKKDLYFYLIDLAIECYQRDYLVNVEQLPTDLFERLLYLGRERMRFALSEPALYRLLFRAFVDPPEELQTDIQARYAGYQQASLQMIYTGLERTRFREDVPVEKAVSMVYLLMDGIFNQSLAELKRLSPEQSLDYIDRLSQQVQQYFEMIQHGVYR